MNGSSLLAMNIYLNSGRPQTTREPHISDLLLETMAGSLYRYSNYLSSSAIFYIKPDKSKNEVLLPYLGWSCLVHTCLS